MIVLGIDPGLTKKNPTALALVDVENMSLIRSCTVYAPASVDWLKRLELVISAMKGMTRIRLKIDLVAYEIPYIGKNPQSTIKLAHVCGAACGLGPPFVPVSPTQAKLALTGDGGADKESMIKMAINIFEKEVCKDEADAIGIAMAGEAIYRREQYAL